MSDEGKPLTPDQTFKKIVWRITVSLGHTMEQATTWSLSGVAAIMALFISNLDSIGSLVSRSGLKWFLILFTGSLIFGAISKQIGMALTKGLEMVEKLESMMFSEHGQSLMSQMATSSKVLMEEIAKPFFWPISAYMRRAGIKGTTDYLHGDKNFVRLFCIQLIFVYLHGLLAAGGLVVVAMSISQKS